MLTVMSLWPNSCSLTQTCHDIVNWLMRACSGFGQPTGPCAVHQRHTQNKVAEVIVSKQNQLHIRLICNHDQHLSSAVRTVSYYHKSCSKNILYAKDTCPQYHISKLQSHMRCQQHQLQQAHLNLVILLVIPFQRVRILW